MTDEPVFTATPEPADLQLKEVPERVDLQADSWTPSTDDEEDFNSCQDDEENISPRNYQPNQIVLSPLPFVLELPSRAKKNSYTPAAEQPSESLEQPSAFPPPMLPPKKVSYSVRSCSEDEIPSFEEIANRTVGTFGFIAGLVVYFGFCCCTFSRNTSNDIAETYTKHTLFSYAWPLEP